ncbi:MAG TPA: hypothetical protein VMU26_20320 [Candidatus Polarisedimenticolia bacterium]|nr:hypothetical protein [Candidatus Polarisedimenticolia bacterium]
MNPLIQNSVDGVGLRFNHWENLVKEKIGEVRKLEAKPSGTAVAAVVAPVQPVIAVAPASQAEQSE